MENQNQELKTLLYETLKANNIQLLQTKHHFRKHIFDNFDDSNMIKYTSLSKEDKKVKIVFNKHINIVDQKYVKMFDEFTIHFKDNYENCTLNLRLEAKDSDMRFVRDSFVNILLYGKRLMVETSYKYYLKMGMLSTQLDLSEVEHIYSILNEKNNKNIEQQKIEDAIRDIDRINNSKQILNIRLCKTQQN